MKLEFKKAVRRAVPVQVAFYGPSGSGKTLSALRFAAGLCPGGKVAVLDTERGRASLYADSKLLAADLPQGYDVIELDAPYHPTRFSEVIDLAERSGYKILVIDSSSDSWNGPGGCEDISETDGGKWIKAKQANRRMTMKAGLSDMHIIWCFKAQSKTKVIDKTKSASGKQEFHDMGILPIGEKNCLYPLLLVFSVDPDTHVSTIKKVHEDLRESFSKPSLITKADGEKVRLWNQGGKALDPNEQLFKRASAAAGEGLAAYQAFFSGLPKDQAATIRNSPEHEENKVAATLADVERMRSEAEAVEEEIIRKVMPPTPTVPQPTAIPVSHLRLGR